MRQPRLLIALLFLPTACGSTQPAGSVTQDELAARQESTLAYPGASDVTQATYGEWDGGTGWFNNQDPSPATAKTHFYTHDRVDRVVAWYDAWLGPHGWLDARDQGNGDRRWERGASEDFHLRCTYQTNLGQLICYTQYTLRGPQFKPPIAPAPPLGDPVGLAAVQERQVGLAATEDRVYYLGGQLPPADRTPAAAAARARWPSGVCCAIPVMLDDSAMAESSTRSAYHALLLQVAEYNRPEIQGGAFGSIERNEILNLTNAGFVLANVGRAGVNGAPANAYLYERGLREAVIFSISYGLSMPAAPAVDYRVATVQIVYVVAPKSCGLSRPECFDILAGTANAVWSHA